MQNGRTNACKRQSGKGTDLMHNGTTATCRHLATLRDSLLPRLLSGSVRVKGVRDAERVVAEATG